MKRGIFILFEGVDHCGKTTQTKLLDEKLKKLGYKNYIQVFPDRTTIIGNTISDFLKEKKEFNEKSISLLFSANRWEKFDFIKNLLLNGINIIMDRYVFSGIVYNLSKPNKISMEQIIYPELGLLSPDFIIYLKSNKNFCDRISDKSIERFETHDFQNNCIENYNFIFKNWKKCKIFEIECKLNIDEIGNKIFEKLKFIVDSNENSELKYFEKDDFNFLLM